MLAKGEKIPLGDMEILEQETCSFLAHNSYNHSDKKEDVPRVIIRAGVGSFDEEEEDDRARFFFFFLLFLDLLFFDFLDREGELDLDLSLGLLSGGLLDLEVCRLFFDLRLS